MTCTHEVPFTTETTRFTPEGGGGAGGGEAGGDDTAGEGVGEPESTWGGATLSPPPPSRLTESSTTRTARATEPTTAHCGLRGLTDKPPASLALVIRLVSGGDSVPPYAR